MKSTASSYIPTKITTRENDAEEAPRTEQSEIDYKFRVLNVINETPWELLLSSSLDPIILITSSHAVTSVAVAGRKTEILSGRSAMRPPTTHFLLRGLLATNVRIATTVLERL
jgi:hypothetical protein